MNTEKQLKQRKISTIKELRDAAAAWDDLWQRSEVCFPKAKAHLLALWLEHSNCTDNFEAVIIEDDAGTFLAAMPLVFRPFKKIFRTGSLATSNGIVSGDFLLDPCCGTPKVLDLLVGQLANSNVSFLNFERVSLNETRWQKFIAALNRANLLVDVKKKYEVGQVKFCDDWTTYEEGLSRKHHSSLRRSARSLDRAGETNFELISDFQLSEIKSLLMRGFEVEDRSWKGAKETSVLRTPGMFDYLYKNALYLAEKGELRLAFLTHKGRPIAFSFNLYSRGIHFGLKMGYDETYARFGPGHLLLMHYLNYLHNLPRDENRLLDFGGPLAPWTQHWMTHSYPVGQIFATTNAITSKMLFQMQKGIKSSFSRP